MLSRAGIFLTLPAPVLRGEEVLRPLGYQSSGGPRGWHLGVTMLPWS